MADRNLRIRMLLEAGDRVTRPLRDMAGGSSRLAQSLKATRDRLKEIDRAQADIAGFRQLKAGMQSTSAAMQAAKTRAAALGREISQTTAPTKAMAREFANPKDATAMFFELEIYPLQTAFLEINDRLGTQAIKFAERATIAT